MRATIIVILVFAMALCFLPGCGKKAPQADGGYGTPDTDATATAPVKTTVTEAELGVPVYPGAVLQASSTAETRKGAVTRFTMTTPDSFSKVADFYKTKLNTTNTFKGTTTALATAVFKVEKNGTEITVSVTTNKPSPETMILVKKRAK